MFETLAAVLLFGFSPDSSTAPQPHRVVGVGDKEACVIIAKDMAKRFERQYPTGSFIAECRDNEQRTYFIIKNLRAYPVAINTEVV